VSLYGDGWGTDADDHADTCARWVECACPDPLAHSRGRIGEECHWLYFGAGTCSCLCGPIVYQGSHVLPASDDKRGGTFGFGEIAGFITRDGRDDGPVDDDQPWPYLRATMHAQDAEEPQDAVLDRPLVLSLRDYLSDWLAATDPTETHVPRWHGPVVDVHLPEGA
jgi:hypothetical protein